MPSSPPEPLSEPSPVVPRTSAASPPDLEPRRLFSSMAACERCSSTECAQLQAAGIPACPLCSCVWCDGEPNCENAKRSLADLKLKVAEPPQPFWLFWVQKDSALPPADATLESFEEELREAITSSALTDIEVSFLEFHGLRTLLRAGNADLDFAPSSGIRSLLKWSDKMMEFRAASRARSAAAIPPQALQPPSVPITISPALAAAIHGRSSSTKRRKTRASPEATEKQLKAAKRLWSLVLQVGDLSGLFREYEQRPSEKTAFEGHVLDKWKQIECGTLNGACAAWARLGSFCKRKGVDFPAGVDGFQLAEFFKDAKAKGPTAAQALHASLRFLETHALFRLDTGYHLINAKPPPAHEPDPAEPIALSAQLGLELLAAGHELPKSLARTSDSGPAQEAPYLATLSKDQQYFAAVLGSSQVNGIRQAHNQRSTTQSYQLFDDAYTMWCSKGKSSEGGVRRGFHWVCQGRGILNLPLFEVVIKKWTERSTAVGAPIPFLLFAPVPSLAATLQEIRAIGTTAMRSDQFQRLLQGTAQQLGFTPEEVAKWSGHSGRHFLESVALARGLTIEEQAALNHWSYGTGQVSSVSKSIPVRYAAAKTKLALSYKVQKSCVISLRVLLARILHQLEDFEAHEDDFDAAKSQEFLDRATWGFLWAAASQISWDQLVLIIPEALAQVVEKLMTVKPIAVPGSLQKPLPEGGSSEPGIEFKFKPIEDAADEPASEDPAAQDEEDPALDTDSEISDSGPALTKRWIAMNNGQIHLYKDSYQSDPSWVVARGLQCNRRLGAASTQGSIPTDYPPHDRPWCSSCSLKAPKGFFKPRPAAAPSSDSSTASSSSSSTPSFQQVVAESEAKVQADLAAAVAELTGGGSAQSDVPMS